jgi:TonB family protein
MRSFLKDASLLILIIIFLGIDPGQNSAQSKGEETCFDPIYNSKEVIRRAKITQVTEPSYTEEARAKGVRGTVMLRAVFCRTGKVTNIEVVQGLPYGLTENAVESTRRIKFKPAEKDGEAVSQYIKRECSFNLY